MCVIDTNVATKHIRNATRHQNNVSMAFQASFGE